MSWFSKWREQEGEEEKDGEDEEEEEESDSLNLAEIASATGAAVKEDLSNLRKSFTRQLWGVASLAPPSPPPEKSSAAIADRGEEAGGSVVEEENPQEHGDDGFRVRSASAAASEIEFQNGQGSSTLQNLGLAEESSSNTTAGGGTSGGDALLGLRHESDPLLPVSPHDNASSSSGGEMALSGLNNRGVGRPKLTGLRSDFAELRGTVATGISRITSVLREVARDDDDSGDEDGEEQQQQDLPLVSSRESPHHPLSSPRGSEQGVNSPRRAFDSFLKPLFGKMLMRERSFSGDSTIIEGEGHPAEEEGAESGVDSPRESLGKGEARYGELESLPSAIIASGISGISKFASSLLHMVDEQDELEDQNLAEVGLTEPVVTFARNIAMHPETWLDFPLVKDDADDEFELTDAQKDHLRALGVAVPGLEALKIELCPNYMTEGRFWKIYFVLMHSRLTLNEALMLSNPQVVKARESMLRELQRREQEIDELHPQQEDSMNEVDSDAIEGREQDSKEGEGNFGGTFASPAIDSSAISNPASSSSFATTKQVEEVSEAGSGSREETDLIESEAAKGRFSMAHLEDETEVDEWPDEEPSSQQEQESGDPHSHSNTNDLDEEDVSFSDLEEDDNPSDKAAGTNEATSSSTPRSSDSVVLDSAPTLPFAAKEASSPMNQGDGTPRKSSKKGEFNDWFKVGQDDDASAGSSSP